MINSATVSWHCRVWWVEMRCPGAGMNVSVAPTHC